MSDWSLFHTVVHELPPGGRRHKYTDLCEFYRSIHCHNMAGDTNTQTYENFTGPFTAIIWQETQIHRLMKTIEFNHKI
jgi:hypothetical protein